ncbi:MAG: sensor histidine kinase [Actinomycetia bacterium]|nr:sensor histidine kinase [Actinomycetes bacterium]
MLKNLNVGAKIMVLVAVPILALTVFGVSTALDSRHRSSSASSGAESIALADLVSDVAHQVGVEAFQSLVATSGDGATSVAAAELLEQRPVVDAATTRLTAQASVLAGLTTTDLTGLFSHLGGIGDLRGSIDDGTADPDQVRNFHQDLANRFQALERDLLATATADVATVSDGPSFQAITAITVGALALTALLALVVIRSITVPLGHLSHAADELAQRTLPAVAEGLRTPDRRRHSTQLTPIDVDQEDELGQLASSMGRVQEVAAEVTKDQASTLEQGISDLFVNLARRNQTLLDRQLTFIDELEAREQDPDVLADLFRLDHLATRMRRNAENLLVLAGLDSPRRRGEPVEMKDVLRVAIGEVEDYNRVSIVALDPIAVDGNTAVDIAHLTAELLENATSFSPPDTVVELMGSHVPGGYAIAISDHGVGMSPEAVNAANETLTTPPVIGFELSRSLGFIVVGHLAKRLGVTVKIGEGANGGTAAVVSIPSAVLGAVELNPAPHSPTEAAPTPTEPVAPPTEPQLDMAIEPPPPPSPPAPGPEPAPEGLIPDTSEAAPAPPVLPQLTPSATLEDVIPGQPDFDAELANLMPKHPQPPIHDDSAPTNPILTAAGLPKRVPPAADDNPGSPRGPASAPSKRSPEEVRTMLARYRNGLHHGRGETLPHGAQP